MRYIDALFPRAYGHTGSRLLLGGPQPGRLPYCQTALRTSPPKPSPLVHPCLAGAQAMFSGRLRAVALVAHLDLVVCRLSRTHRIRPPPSVDPLAALALSIAASDGPRIAATSVAPCCPPADL